jgi:endogenous inhibitor of DNA gyrase (YacG/DUF329 family)
MAEADHRPRKKCPICGKPAEPDFSPFCSKRCADVDLHRWLAGVYTVPAVEEEPSETDVPQPDETNRSH